MEEVKCPRNKLDIEVNVDTDEAQERIERLTQAAEKCTKAFEELGDAIASLGTLIQIPEVKDHIEFFNKDIANGLND
ncbi:hypothetical protein BF32_5499 (plasmid) [Bacillus thuringiensis]|uniref:hypothetical protein n=1 Tax=Bacillus thuringiensis TaxID=1428 RepID=UPI0000E8A64B|nr:hypothetical protein [Bacillus thuringiensis]HDR4520536.1 hypothetical protein [Bacillus cereus]ABK88162.1 conserved hypothetical protein [Bacillus thuringiensis str. Al Hakam]AJH66332.1 hypothetical protein BF32_5499 [Bacillus thuringiensis]QKH33358.1 hypothetical protein FOC87_27200 [Bacillus thuringiensis]QKQ37845.1 hypothetical protein FOC85_00340 [Bacillus thuringiensis]